MSASEIRGYQIAVAPWALHNFPNDTAETAVLGLCEEAGEVARAALKRFQGIRGTDEQWSAILRAECADVFFKLCHIAAIEDFDLANAIYTRWAEVNKRDFVADRIGHGLPDGR